MLDRNDSIVEKLRFLFVGVLIIAAFFVLWLLIASAGTAGAQTTQTSQPSDAISTDPYQGANAVTNVMTTAGSRIGQTLSGTGRAMDAELQSTGHAVSRTGSIIGHVGLAIGKGTLFGVAMVAKGIGTGTFYVAKSIGSGFVIVVRIPIHLVGFITHAGPVNAVVKPADHSPVPIIDPQSPALLAAQKAFPASPTNKAAATPAAAPVNPEVVWPIHGVITTEFGVPELPYQAIHTGLDISDAARPGATPVHAYRSGVVVDVIHGGGLGNHVIIDHGNGLTSVYGHLDSTSVTIGQHVDTSTVVGFEGTTGVSTGVHLHFEIRVNGQAANPHQFISGMP